MRNVLSSGETSLTVFGWVYIKRMDHARDKGGGLMGCTMRLSDVSLHGCGMPDCGCMTRPLSDGKQAGLTSCSDYGQNGASKITTQDRKWESEGIKIK